MPKPLFIPIDYTTVGSTNHILTSRKLQRDGHLTKYRSGTPAN